MITKVETDFEDIAQLDLSKEGRMKLYEAAKAAKVGSTIVCPGCGKEHIKTTYHKVFDSNSKTSNIGNNCKDTYWNIVLPDRLLRGRQY